VSLWILLALVLINTFVGISWLLTYVAPTVLSLRNSGVKEYLTNLPLLASSSPFPSSPISERETQYHGWLGQMSLHITPAQCYSAWYNVCFSSLTRVWWFCYLKQSRSWFNISQLESYKLNTICVSFRAAQITCNGVSTVNSKKLLCTGWRNYGLNWDVGLSFREKRTLRLKNALAYH